MRAISYKNEQSVHYSLLEMFSVQLAKYPTSLEEDMEILKSESLTSNQRNAVLFRVGEKEICEFFIDSSKQCLELMEMKFTAAKKKT